MSYERALLVDDDPVFRALAEDMVLDAGVASTKVAENGHQALACLDSGYAPDLLMCDLNMPTHDGVSLMRSLADRGYPGNVLIVSGEAGAVIEAVSRLARLQGLNVIGALRKPLSTLALEEALSASRLTDRQMQSTLAHAGSHDEGIDCGVLQPHFQAKVSLVDRSITGAEALMRVQRSGGEFVSPMPCIQLAERNGSINELTLRMARAVAGHARTFVSNGKLLPVALNISPASLKCRDFPDLLAEAVESAGAMCSQFTLEITETGIVEYGPDALEILVRMRIKGFGLSVDDFGTGHSNIDRLRRYPFTELKIDQSFTRAACTDGFARASVEMSVRLAREMGLKVVAEGVETVEMWNLLASLGVDEAQGFLMAKPVGPAAFAILLNEGLPELHKAIAA